MTPAIKHRLDEAQNEYLEITTKLFQKDYQIKEFGYLWERAKRLQQQIVHLSFIDREKALEEAKTALERAFTPRIKKMLERTLEKEKESE